MCEIFVVRGNKKGIRFELEALKMARSSNSDGAGYVIFEKDKFNKFDVVKVVTLEPKPAIRYETYQTNEDSYQYTGEEVDDDFPGCSLVDEAQLDTDNPVIRSYLRQKHAREERARIEAHYNRRGVKQKKKKKVVHTYPVYPEDNIPQQIFDEQAKLKGNQLLVAHFRFATSGGVTDENTHPIINGDYLVIHNGVFGYTELPPGMSDTRYFSEVLKVQAKKRNVHTPKGEQKLLIELLKKAGGYHSIFIYSWKTKTLFYFKSEFASFSHDQSGLLGATREARFPMVTLEPKNGIVR